jgi:hypothetical protein
MSETTRTAPTLAELRARRDEILRLAEQHGAYNVRIFGSVARGEATAESDVDLLVDFQEGATIWDAVGLWQDLQELLAREVSLIGDEDQETRFMRRIRKDAVLL